MNYVENFFEPSRLWLIWQFTDGDGKGVSRTRRKVAEIVKTGNDPVVFRYLTNTSDYQAALNEKFNGYPAFKLGDETFTHNVIEAFVRRLPPRTREDFDKYLNMHRLPLNFAGSNMALLGYTGAKLPGDAFEIIPDYSDAKLPIEFMMEIAGFRYHNVPVNELSIGMDVEFIAEPENAFDSNAIAIHCNNKKIGHVPRSILPAMNVWLKTNRLLATIERINGKADRPLIYLFVTVK